MSLLTYAQELVQREVNDKVLDLPDFVNKPTKKSGSDSHSNDDLNSIRGIEWADMTNLRQATQSIISSITKVKKSGSSKFKPVKADTLLGDIQTLRVVNKAISKFEPVLLNRLSRLETLVLIDNQLTDPPEEQLRNLPSNLQTLTIQANYLLSVPQVSHLRNLTHLGLAYNQITRITPKGHGIFPSLISLDLGFNRLDSLNQILDDLAECLLHRRLKLLVLSGNPACILKHYRSTIIHHLPRLIMLDDTTVSQDERKAKLPENTSNNIEIQIQTGLLELDNSLPTFCTDPAVLKDYMYSVEVTFAPPRPKSRPASANRPASAKSRVSTANSEKQRPKSATSKALLKTDPVSVPTTTDDRKQFQLDKSNTTPVEVTTTLWDSLDAGLVVKVIQHGYNLTLPDKYKIDPKKAKKGGPLFPAEIAKREQFQARVVGQANISLSAVQKGQRELSQVVTLMDDTTKRPMAKLTNFTVNIR